MTFAEIRLAPWGGTSELRLRCPAADADAAPRSRVLTTARAAGGATVVFVGRLHYHADLARRLGLTVDAATATAADWVLAAYRAGGPAALDHLEGEFALMVHDPAAGQVRLQRSPVGDVPLFYAAAAAGGFLAGTDLASVLAGAGRRPQVREEHLARFLIETAFVESDAEEATVYAGAARVAAGTRVVLDARGRAAREWAWDWGRLMDRTTRLTRDAAAGLYRDLLAAAVAERMNGDATAAQHSGGFDSSAVVCLARDRIAAGGGPGPLRTISLDYPFAEMAGEGTYMRLVTDQGGPIDPVYLRDDAALDFDGFPDLVPRHDEPDGYLFRAGIDRQLLAVAAAGGAKTVLTGGGAELLTEPRLEYLTDLVRGGRLRAAAREAKRWAVDRRTHVGALAWEYGVRPLLPAGLRAGVGAWWRGGFAAGPHLPPGTLAPWVRRDFARRADAAAWAAAARRRLDGGLAERLSRVIDLRASARSWAGWHLGVQGHGVVVSHPFVDPRLLAFGLSLPRDVRQEPGQTKPLLAAATKGLLPEPIRTRRYKCGFDRVNLEGFRRALPRLRALVAAAPDAGVIDRPALARAMEAYAQGLGNATVGGHITASLALLVWLGQNDAPAPRPADGATTIDLGRVNPLGRKAVAARA